jgi:rhamnogalacturonyl hydrolase YesR
MSAFQIAIHSIHLPGRFPKTMPDNPEPNDASSNGKTASDFQWILDACGITRSGSAIPVLIHPDASNMMSTGIRVVLIGGLNGRSEDVDATRIAAEQLPGMARGAGVDLVLSVIPVGNPDGLTGEVNPDTTASTTPAHGYPPSDGFFDDSTNPEARYLWRWISFAAPDLVIEVEDGDGVAWGANAAASAMGMALNAASATPDDSLTAALGQGEPSGLAPIPGLRLTASANALEGELGRLVVAMGDLTRRSPARRVLDARRGRSPMEVARLLGRTYGYVLDPVIYTQGVAISGRLRLAELESEAGWGEPDTTPADIAGLVEKYASGQATAFDDQAGGQHLAGLVWCDELSDATDDPRYAAMLIEAADRYRSETPGMPPPPSDDNFRTEDMFFASAVLGRAFGVSGKPEYIELAARFLADADTQKPDGLFMHCQDADWNWGRSNGFAAMGFAELLTCMPADHELRQTLLAAHIKHLDALLRLQQPDGTWLQVLDYPGSYHEMSVTCMVGYALARGIRSGWLGSNYREPLERAWYAAAERIDNEGGLVDVCTGTGVQTNTREYLDRPAEFGFDHRGGSMALWFAIEVERLRRGDNVRG